MRAAVETGGVVGQHQVKVGDVDVRLVLVESYATGLRKSKLEDVLGMIGIRERMTREPGDALSFISGLTHSPAALSLSERTHRRDIDLPDRTHNDLRPYPERGALDQTVRRASDKCNGGSEHAAESAQVR